MGCVSGITHCACAVLRARSLSIDMYRTNLRQEAKGNPTKSKQTDFEKTSIGWIFTYHLIWYVLHMISANFSLTHLHLRVNTT